MLFYLILALVVFLILRKLIVYSPSHWPEAKKVNHDYPYEIVGEGHYVHQINLERLAGGKRYDAAYIETSARLVPEPENPKDPLAVRVDIKNKAVGYISRKDVKRYRDVHGFRVLEVPALICGGWDRGDGDSGSFGVKLKFSL